MLFSDTAIRRPVTTLVAMAAMIIFGWIAFQNMGLDLFPEVDFPYVSVTTTLIGASPEVMDMDVTDVLEEEITTIEGIKSVRSTSYGGLSRIFVEFQLDKDVDVAAQEVRAKVSLAERDLPDDADKPIVDKVDVAAQAIMWIAVSSRGDYARLSHYADKIAKERLQAIPGVGQDTDRRVTGARDPGLAGPEKTGSERAFAPGCGRSHQAQARGIARRPDRDARQGVQCQDRGRVQIG